MVVFCLKKNDITFNTEQYQMMGECFTSSISKHVFGIVHKSAMLIGRIEQILTPLPILCAMVLLFYSHCLALPHQPNKLRKVIVINFLQPKRKIIASVCIYKCMPNVENVNRIRLRWTVLV